MYIDNNIKCDYKWEKKEIYSIILLKAFGCCLGARQDTSTSKNSHNYYKYIKFVYNNGEKLWIVPI